MNLPDSFDIYIYIFFSEILPLFIKSVELWIFASFLPSLKFSDQTGSTYQEGALTNADSIDKVCGYVMAY